MNKEPSITVFAGGIGPERDVSLATGAALTESLVKSFQTSMIDLTEEALPAGLDPTETIIFPAIHGTFGEDGELQTLLEKAGFCYSGSGSESSRVCMDKHLSKEAVRKAGVRVSPDLLFSDPTSVDVEQTVTELGPDLVMKPTDQGSSVALHVVHGAHELKEALSSVGPGNWMIEHRVFGREVTVGILGESALGIVEVIPTGGVYDYERKYSSGSTEYRYPGRAELRNREHPAGFRAEVLQRMWLSGFRPGRLYYLRRRQCSLFGSQHTSRAHRHQSSAEKRKLRRV